MRALGHLLRALAWMRWRVFVNGVRSGLARGGFEGLSRVIEVLAIGALVLLVSGFAVGLSVLGFVAGTALGSGDADSRFIADFALRACLVIATAVIAAGPLLQALVGSERPTARLLLLPVSRRVLHVGAVLSGLTEPWIACLAPAIVLALPAGLALAGRPGAALLALAAGLALVAMFLLLTSISALALALLLRERRRAEVTRFVAALVLACVGFLPMIFSGRLESEPGGQAERAPARLERSVKARDRTLGLPAWTAVLPSELHAAATWHASSDRPHQAPLRIAGLLGLALLAQAASFSLHRRLLAHPAASLSGRRGTAPRISLAPAFGLSPPAAAARRAMLKLAFRTMRGRMAVFGTPLVMVIAGYLVVRFSLRHAWFLQGANPGFSVLAGVGGFSLLALGVFTLNQFAIDRAGLTLEFLSPATERELLRGKAVASVLLVSLATLWGGVLASIVFSGLHPFLVLAAVLAVASATALLAPLSALLSIVLARAADPSRVGREGNAHVAAGLVGFVAALVALVPGFALVGLGRSLLGGPTVALFLVAAWFVASAVVGTVLLIPLEGLLRSRREALALLAAGR